MDITQNKTLEQKRADLIKKIINGLKKDELRLVKNKLDEIINNREKAAK